MSINVPLEGFGGGGGASLNFDVKRYATEEALLAATPGKYTVGIISEHEMTGWIFDVADPAEPVEGMVYITTGTSSDVAFNALKKNGIQVYPLSAKQCVDGALVGVIAMSYQGGKWVDWWGGELYKDGKLYNVLVDGFDTLNTTTKVIYNADHFLVYDPGTAYGGGISSPDKIDVTGFKTISIFGRVTFETGAPDHFKIGLATQKNRDSLVSSVNIPISTDEAESFSVNIPTDGGLFYLIITTTDGTDPTKCVEIKEMVLK